MIPFWESRSTMITDANADYVLVLEKFLRFDFYGIGNFLLIVHKYLFTNRFVDKKTFRLIGNLIFGIIGGPSGSSSKIRSNISFTLNFSKAEIGCISTWEANLANIVSALPIHPVRGIDLVQAKVTGILLFLFFQKTSHL